MAGSLGQKVKEMGDTLKRKAKIGREKTSEKGRDVAEKTKQKLK